MGSPKHLAEFVRGLLSRHVNIFCSEFVIQVLIMHKKCQKFSGTTLIEPSNSFRPRKVAYSDFPLRILSNHLARSSKTCPRSGPSPLRKLLALLNNDLDAWLSCFYNLKLQLRGSCWTSLMERFHTCAPERTKHSETRLLCAISTKMEVHNELGSSRVDSRHKE